MSNIGVSYKRAVDLTELSAIPADGDFFVIVDISDANREKKILASRIVSTTGINLADTTTSTTGVITKASTRFLHNFHHPVGGGAIPVGDNLFLGESAGNFTLGATAISTFESSANVGIGSNSLNSLTTGWDNIAIGQNALEDCTVGTANVGIGTWALIDLTTGNNNTAVGELSMGWGGNIVTGSWNTGCGYLSLSKITSGDSNTALGEECLFKLLSGDNNVAIGSSALFALLSGSNNIAIGTSAGWYITGGATANETSGTSIYIGRNTRAKADADANEIIIGDSVTGLGSNTVVIGNDSIVSTTLKGTVKVKELNSVSFENATVYFEGNAVFN